MMRYLNVAIAFVAVAGVIGLVVVMGRGKQTEGLRLRGKAIEIYGQGYTLAKLAEEINDPEIFAYDPKRREGLSMASLVVHGSLRIGDPEDKRKGESLILDTVVCGDLRLEVVRGGLLEVFHSDVTTKSKQITVDACSLGYALFVDGKFVARDSRFLYMSGSRSETARRNAEVHLQDVLIALSDGCSFHTVKADGRKLDIRDTRFSCEGQYGFIVEGPGEAPIVLRRCELRGTSADLALTGHRSEAELVDCVFSKAKVKFFQRNGRVAVSWTVKTKVVEEGTGKPVPRVTVVAESTGNGPAQTKQAVTGDDGTCELVLTEYVATSDAPERQMEFNGVTPHRVAARSADGTLLATLDGHSAEGPRAEVILEVPAQALAAAR